jgi:adenosylcobinamide-phosphate synthase
MFAAGSLIAAVLVEKASRKSPVLQALSTAAVTWSMLGAANLVEEGTTISRLLEKEDFAAVKRAFARFEAVPSGLDEGEGVQSKEPHAKEPQPGLDQAMSDRLNLIGLSRTSIEIIARETLDAVVSPLLWGALAGVPGLVISQTLLLCNHYQHRMIQNAVELARFPASQLASGLAVAVTPVIGGVAEDTRRTHRRDVIAHPTPNTARIQAAFAGALRVRIGGRTGRPSPIRELPVLGDGRNPDAGHVNRAIELSRLIGWLAGAVSALLALAKGMLARRQQH